MRHPVGKNQARVHMGSLSFMHEDAKATLGLLKSITVASNASNTKEHVFVTGQKFIDFTVSQLQSFFDKIDRSITSIMESIIVEELEEGRHQRQAFEDSAHVTKIPKESTETVMEEGYTSNRSFKTKKIKISSTWGLTRAYLGKSWHCQVHASWKVRSGKLSKISPSRIASMLAEFPCHWPLKLYAMPCRISCLSRSLLNPRTNASFIEERTESGVKKRWDSDCSMLHQDAKRMTEMRTSADGHR